MATGYKPCVYIYLLFRTLFTYTVHRTTIDMVRFCTVWLRSTLITSYTFEHSHKPLIISTLSWNGQNQKENRWEDLSGSPKGETHQVSDNPLLSPIRDGVGDRNPTLPNLCCSGYIQAAASNMLGNCDSSDRKGDLQTNCEEDYESFCNTSACTLIVM